MLDALKRALPSERAARRKMMAAARDLADRQVLRGVEGNYSTRLGADILVTPTGASIDECQTTPAQFARISLSNGQKISGKRKPTSETDLHVAIYKSRPDIGAIVHAHMPYSTALACRGEGIRPVHYYIGLFGSDGIPCAPYALFGTPAFALGASRALEGHMACLLANHGSVILGGDLDEAIRLAVALEEMAGYAILAGGSASDLSADQIAELVSRFARR